MDTKVLPLARLLFTSEKEPLVWNDAMTGLESRSLTSMLSKTDAE